MELARPINNIGVIYFDYLQNSAKAREYNEKALEIQIRHNKLEGIAIDYHNIGETYWMEDNYGKALEYFLKCEELAAGIELNNTLFTVYVNILRTYTDLGDYQNAYEYLIKAENEAEKFPDQGWDLPFFYESGARFYYMMGDLNEADDYCIKGMESSVNTNVSEKSYLNLRSLKILIDSSRCRNIDFMEINSLLDAYRKTDLAKDRLKAVQLLTELLLMHGKKDKAFKLLWESGKLMELFETGILKATHLYLEGLTEGGKKGASKIEEAAEIAENEKNLPVLWKFNRALGELYFRQGDMREAAFYFIKEMEILYRLVLKVPEDYRTVFMTCHERNHSRERLLYIKSRMMREEIEVMDSEKTSEPGLFANNLELFFNPSDFSVLLKSDGINDIFCFKEELGSRDLIRVSELVGKNPEDFEGNLRHILDTACKITGAEKGYILIYDENENIKVLLSEKNAGEPDIYEYLIEHARENRQGLFITDFFGKNQGSTNILPPPGQKGIMCVPVCEGPDDSDTHKRRSRESANKNIRGFIYLTTGSLFNNFTDESFRAVNVLSNMAFLSLENYNLKILSSIDRLTGVYNRKYFESMILQLIKKAEVEGFPLSIVMIDIDKFKKVNDRYGHQKGDEVLKNVGRILKENIRQSDVCCRYGGEEFIILFPGTGPEEMEIIGERIRSSVEEAQIMGNAFPLTVSIGISSFPKQGKWKDELIGKADQALYHAKETGRNRYCIWNNKIGKSTKRMDKLAGILSGNEVQDQRNVLAILEIVQFIKEKTPFEQKIFKILGRINETLEAEQSIFFLLDDKKASIKKTFGRKRFDECLSKELHFNRKILDKVMFSKFGKYFVDWDNFEIVDQATGEPKWQSVVAVPVIYKNEIKAVLYLTTPISVKEFGFSEFNFVSTLADIMSLIAVDEELASQ